jgi:transcriptional regulator with XRE-family HTH domain
MQIHDEVAGELRAHMARRRISSRKIAHQLGWSEVYLSRRLTGAVPFNVNDLAAVAEILDLPISSLFDAPQVVRMSPRSRNLRFSTPARAAA